LSGSLLENAIKRDRNFWRIRAYHSTGAVAQRVCFSDTGHGTRLSENGPGGTRPRRDRVVQDSGDPGTPHGSGQHLEVRSALAWRHCIAHHSIQNRGKLPGGYG
jgi:hypothetical protein